VGLLRGELSDDVLAALTTRRTGLFPEPGELELDCSCPDSGEVCQARCRGPVWVGIPSRRQAELFFVLRQVDQAELLSRPPPAQVSRARPAAGKRIADDRLIRVFGIELEEAPLVRAARAGRPSQPGKRRA